MLLLQVLYKVAGTAQEIKFLVKNSSDKFQQFHLFIYLFTYLFICLFIYIFLQHRNFRKYTYFLNTFCFRS